MMSSKIQLIYPLLLVLVLQACAAIEYDEEWELWKSVHKKSYTSVAVDTEKYRTWMNNKKFVYHHNLNMSVTGYTLALNQFADLSIREYSQELSQHRDPNNHFTDWQAPHTVYSPPVSQSYPDVVDWRSKDAVTDVQNQGQCAAPYAFAAVGALEGAQSLAQKSLVSLSVQNVIDCAVPFGENGCNGGNVKDAFKYVISNGGVDTSTGYPAYMAKQGECRYTEASYGGTMTGIVTIQSGSEEDLLSAVAGIGPIAVTVDAQPNAFRFYSGGILNTIRCSSVTVNHPLLLIGYGEDNGRKYWLLKNSWGTNWGISGYIKMSRDSHNQCGIATAASYPLL